MPIPANSKAMVPNRLIRASVKVRSAKEEET